MWRSAFSAPRPPRCRHQNPLAHLSAADGLRKILNHHNMCCSEQRARNVIFSSTARPWLLSKRYIQPFDRSVSVAKNLEIPGILQVRGKITRPMQSFAGVRSLVLKHLFDRDLHRITERGGIVSALKGEDHWHRPAGKNALDYGTDAFMRDPNVGMTVIDMDIIAS